MAVPQSQIFDRSGPTYLKSVDWNNAIHRRCVLASLVQGVYVLENDRRMKRTGPKSLASPWWQFFHFDLVETLYDQDSFFEQSVIGAVLRLSSSKSGNVVTNSPKYVIAFRGVIVTTLDPPVYKDILLCIRSLYGILHNSTRFLHAVGRVQHWVAKAGGATNVWLTGHSLGSAIALLAAKNIAMSDRRLPTYLFNPPFPSALWERTDSKILRQGIHFGTSVVKAGVCNYFQNQSQQKKEEDQFSVLSDWVPCLFLNPDDPICSGYIGYFEDRVKMNRLGAGAVEDLATKHTFRSLVMTHVFDIKSEPRHLLPSAELIINQARSPCFKDAHGVHQWWKNPNLPLHPVTYRYKK